MEKRFYEEDDGRTVADMSGVEKRSVLSAWISPRAEQELTREANAARRARQSDPAGERRSPYGSGQTADLDRSERLAAIRGALGASLLIGIIFLAAAAILIIGLLFLWGAL